MSTARAVLAPLVAAAGALALAAALLLPLGADPARALAALLDGAAGDRLAIESTLLRTGPLLLTGLGIAIAFRSGVWNIGAEGQLAAGALAATLLATRVLHAAPAPLLLPAAIAAGVAAGAALGGIAAALAVRRGVSEVLSTLMLNFVALLAVAAAVHGPLQEAAAAYPQSDPFPEAARLPLMPGLGRVHAGLALALAAPLAAWVLMFRSAAGLRLRAVGASPTAARYAGLSPEREATRAMLLSAGLAGLAGALEVTGVTGRLFENLSPGYGFTAIAVALLGRLHPLGIVPAALFLAALDTGSGAMQRVAAVPSVTVRIVEALVILLSVGFALPRRSS